MDANKRNTENKEKMRGPEEEGEGERKKGRTRGGNFYSHVAGIAMSDCS